MGIITNLFQDSWPPLQFKAFIYITVLFPDHMLLWFSIKWNTLSKSYSIKILTLNFVKPVCLIPYIPNIAFDMTLFSYSWKNLELILENEKLSSLHQHCKRSNSGQSCVAMTKHGRETGLPPARMWIWHYHWTLITLDKSKHSGLSSWKILTELLLTNRLWSCWMGTHSLLLYIFLNNNLCYLYI